MPSALQQPVRDTITAAPHQVQLDRLAHTMWNDQNLQPQNTQKSLGVPTFLLLGMKRNAYSKAAFFYAVSHWQWDSQIRPSGPDLTGMLWAIWIPWEKKKYGEVSTPATEHSCKLTGCSAGTQLMSLPYLIAFWWKYFTSQQSALIAILPDSLGQISLALNFFQLKVFNYFFFFSTRR